MNADRRLKAEPFLDGTAPPTDLERVHPHVTVNVRSAPLALLAFLGSICVLYWASAVFIPLLLGVLASYALSPLVERLQRCYVPRVLGAATLLLAIVGGVGSMAYALSDDAVALSDSLSDAARKLREAVRVQRGAPESSIDKMQRAAAKLGQAAAESGSSSAPVARGVTRVQIERPRFDMGEFLWSSTLGLVGVIGQAMVVLFIAFFLLTSGDSFRRKMVKIAGPSFSKKKITIQAPDEINGQIQRYLLLQIVTSVLVGLATWLAMWWIGLEHAAVWGVLAAVLNLVPYIGSVATAGGLALLGFLQFGTVSMALTAGGISFFINTIEGGLLTPWLTGRASRLNPVVVFVGMVAWGWLWGLWGLLLGPPLLMVAKAVCDRVDELKPIGELLGD